MESSGTLDNGVEADVEKMVKGRRYFCDACNGPIHPQSTIYHCDCVEEDFDICLSCALSRQDLTSQHACLEPCFIDRRDKRRTFIPGPDVEELRSLIANLKDTAALSWKLPWQYQLFFQRMDIDGISKAALSSTDTFEESDSFSSSVLTKKIENDYSGYSPLDPEKKEIRMAILMPGSDDDPIQVSTVPVAYPWKDRPPWSCLSYTWGSLDETRKIRLVHVHKTAASDEKKFQAQPGRIFSCTVSLETALRELRDKEEFVFVWVDALCINQSDLKERASQVALMSQIYNHAYRVVIWFGNDPEIAPAASSLWWLTEHMRRLKQKVASAEGTDDENRYEDQVVLQFMARQGGQPGELVSNLASGVVEFFSNKWFTRAWVVQEVWSARSISLMCGDRDHQLSWDFVSRANFLLRRYADIGAKFIGATEKEDRSDGTYSVPASGKAIWSRLGLGSDGNLNSPAIPAIELFDMVSMGLEAGDPRDLVFSILGMSLEVCDMPLYPPLIAPDYSKPPTQVFFDFTRWHILHHKSLNILGDVTYIQRGEHQRLGGSVPSWSLSPKLAIGWAIGGTLCERTVFQADAGTPLDTHLVGSELRDHSLTTRGYTMDRISWVDEDFLAPKFKADTRNDNLMEEPPFPWRFRLNARGQGMLHLQECGIEWLWRFARYKQNVKKCDAQEINKETHCSCRLAFDTFLDTISCGGVARSGLRDKMDGGALADARYKFLERTKLYGYFAAHWVATTTDPQMEKYLCEPLRKLLLPLADGTDKEAFSDWVMEGSYKKSFFMTESGAMGVCHPDARKGDPIVVLFGCRAPVVLTQRCQKNLDKSPVEQEAVSDNPTSWRFVGECYLHELMDGRLVKEKIDSNVAAESFVLE